MSPSNFLACRSAGRSWDMLELYCLLLKNYGLTFLDNFEKCKLYEVADEVKLLGFE